MYTDQVIDELKKFKPIKEICGIFGMYDILIKITTNDSKNFDEIISTQIRTVENIISTVTLTIDNSKEN